MSKSPAFRLYASDFYVDTVGWTATEVGAYIRLLLHQWAEGPLPDDLNILARIAGVDRKTMGKFWLSCVGKKFVKNALGTWENSRLEETRQAQINYTESQRELGKIGADKRWKNHRVAHENPNGENIALQFSSSNISTKVDMSTNGHCPHSSIIELYHKTLPMLPRLRVLTDARKKHLSTRWKEDKERQDLKWWSGFFDYIAQSKFLTGKVTDRNGKAFLADLGWIIKPENFAKIIEGKYE